MKTIYSLYIAFVTLVGASLRAQQMDYPVTIPISYYGEAIIGSGTASFTFGASLGASNYGQATAPSGVTFFSSVTSSTIIPGKTYNVTVSSNLCVVVFAHFQSSTPGVKFYIENCERSTITMGTNYSFKLRAELANEFTDELAKKRGGECTSFPEDKPIWYVGLGKTRAGQFAGAVGFRAGAITPSLINPAALNYDSVDLSDIGVERDGSGNLSRIIAREVVLTIGAYDAANKLYEIKVFHPSDLTNWFIKYTIKDDGTGSGIQIDRTEDGETWSAKLHQDGATGWTFYDWQRNATLTNPIVTVINGATSTVTRGSGAGSVVKQKVFASGELASVTYGPGAQSAPVTSYTYYTSSSGTGWAKAVNTVTEPSGRWTKYDYFNNVPSGGGQIMRMYRPWQDSPGVTAATATTTNCDVELYDYVKNYDGTYTSPFLKERRVNGTTVNKTTWSYNWSYTTANSQTVAQVVQHDYSSASSYLTTTTLAFRGDNPSTFYRNKVYSVARPNGTKDSYAYYFGTYDSSTNSFSVNANGNDRRLLVFHGQTTAGSGGVQVTAWGSWNLDPLYLVPNLSTVSDTITDTTGHVVFTGEHVVTGASTMEIISGKLWSYNNHALLAYEKDVVRSVPGGDVTTSYTYAAGLATTKTNIDGTRTRWVYDDNLRLATLTLADGASGSYPSKTQTFTYYGSGLKNTEKEYSAASSVSTYYYETTGRINSKTEPRPGGGVLTTSYSYPAANRSVATLPTNATTDTTFYLDGRVKEEGGTARVDVQYLYSVDPTTGNLVVLAQNGSSTANGWSEQTADWLGRVVKLRTPTFGFTPGASFVLRKTYTFDGTTGLLARVSSVDESQGSARVLPDHFYYYGNLGLCTREGDDVGNNSSLDDASADRVTTHSISYWKDTGGYNGWVRDEITKVLRTRDNSTETATTNWTRTRLTRFNAGQLLGSARVTSDVVSIDPSGRATSAWEWIDPAARTKTQYSSTSGVSQSAGAVWQDGYLKSHQSMSGVSTTYTYGSSGLLASTTEGSTNAATTYDYYDATNYLWHVTATTGPSSTATSTYSYSWCDGGRQSNTMAIADAAGNVSYVEYDALGREAYRWGTGVEPSRITYDSFGRKWKLTTWQTGSFSGTTWPNPAGGNTVEWTPDAGTGLTKEKVYPNGSKVVFTYNARGQVKTRVARGVTTAYDFWDGVSGMDLTGEVRQVSYNLAFGWSRSYTRFGAPHGITDAAGNRVLNYRSDLQLDNESLGSFYGSRTLTSNYDGYGRSTGFSFNGGATVSSTLGYDPATNRVNSIAGANGATSLSFSLGYASGTDWVNSVTSGSYTRSVPLLSRMNVVNSATTSWGETQLASFTTTRTDSRGWLNGQTINSASYTSVLGIGSALVNSYGFDGFGRLTSATGTINGVLQSDRNFGWTYDLAGNRSSETGSKPTTYSTADVNADAWGNLNQYESITGDLGESTLKYDGDGNLTNNGSWAITYDGGNRISSMTKADLSQTLTFTYDYLGRRIRKVVTGANPSDTKYLWDGWNLVAELAADGTTVNRTYVWGPDFSNAQGAAGGAGALLAQIGGGVVSYAIPDALGSIVAYANASGAIVAAAEHSPYGRTNRVFGSYTSYPVGFAGHYTDWETGLVYYGMRYYDPKHGRFVNRDPIEEAGGNNLYAFVGNSPVRRWDVLGCDGDVGVLPPYEVVAKRIPPTDPFSSHVPYDPNSFRTTIPWIDGPHYTWLGSYHNVYRTIQVDLGGTWLPPNSATTPLLATAGVFVGVTQSLEARLKSAKNRGMGPNSETTYGGPGMTEGGVTLLEPFNVTASRPRTSNAGRFMAGTLLLAGGMVADDAAVFGIVDDPLVPVVIVGGALIAGGILIHDHFLPTRVDQSRTPAKGVPGSVVVFPDGTTRVYGPDGKAILDIDRGHDHGAGDPHSHDWNWNQPNPRQPGRPVNPGEPQIGPNP